MSSKVTVVVLSGLVAPKLTRADVAGGKFLPPPVDGHEDGTRVELAKFFERAHLDAHMTERTFHGYSDLRIETHEEPLAAQHHAHGGERGK